MLNSFIGAYFSFLFAIASCGSKPVETSDTLGTKVPEQNIAENFYPTASLLFECMQPYRRSITMSNNRKCTKREITIQSRVISTNPRQFFIDYRPADHWQKTVKDYINADTGKALVPDTFGIVRHFKNNLAILFNRYNPKVVQENIESSSELTLTSSDCEPGPDHELNFVVGAYEKN